MVKLFDVKYFTSCISVLYFLCVLEASLQVTRSLDAGTFQSLYTIVYNLSVYPVSYPKVIVKDCGNVSKSRKLNT